MSNKGIYKIDGFQMTALLTILVAATAVMFVPQYVTRIGGHDGWQAILIVTVSGAYQIYILYRLSVLFPGQTLIEYLPRIMGKVGGKLIGLAYILVLTYLAASVLSETLVFLYGTGIFAFTPLIVIVIFMLIATTYGVYAGVETIGRTVSILWLGLVLGSLLYILMIIPYMELEALLPIGEAGLSTILRSSMLPHSFRGQLLVLAMLFPYCRSLREGFIAGNIANLLISFFIIINTIACVTTLGVAFTALSPYAPFFLATSIQPVGLEILLVSVWVIAFWAKISIFQFCLTDGFSQLLSLKEHRSVVLPIAIILLVFSLIFYTNATDFFEKANLILPGTMLFFGYLIPTFLLITALIRSKMQNNTELGNDSPVKPNQAS